MTSWKGGRASTDLPETVAGSPEETDEDGCAGGHPAGACRSLPQENPVVGEEPAKPASGPRRPAAPARRGPADPVRELMHRYRVLNARAVDPLEIAAVLEADGFTDRAAARFRHRDVFSLAEELFARAPEPGADSGAGTAPLPAPLSGPASRHRGLSAGAVVHVLPGTLCAVTLCALTLNGGPPAPVGHVVGAVGAVAVGVSLRLSVQRIARSVPAALLALSACWLVAYALFGDWLLARLLGGTAEQGGPAAGFTTAVEPSAVLTGVPVLLSLTCAVLPAAVIARWFRVHARRRLAVSRGLDAFASGVRPLIAAAVSVFALVLAALQFAVHRAVDADAGVQVEVTALGVLLFLALLLTAHGFPSAAAVGLGAASLVEAATVACAVVFRPPGFGGQGGQLARAVAELGPAVVPAVACGGAALALWAYALRALTGASSHHREAAS